MSIELLFNLTFVAIAIFLFHRCLRLVHDWFNPNLPKRGCRVKIMYLSGLVTWFVAATLSMSIGLSGLFEKLILALQ